MASIKVKLLQDNTYFVEVVSQVASSHQVNVQPAYALRLTLGKISTEQLIEKSFEFLLAREPNTSILRSFDLSIISQYFPEFEREICK